MDVAGFCPALLETWPFELKNEGKVSHNLHKSYDIIISLEQGMGLRHRWLLVEMGCKVL